jgi:hypothetical protein
MVELGSTKQDFPNWPDEVVAEWLLYLANRDDTAEYAATQTIAELFHSEGYDGVAYKTALPEAKLKTCSPTGGLSPGEYVAPSVVSSKPPSDR